MGNGGGHIQPGAHAEGFRRGLDRLLITGGEGPQRVLHPVTELPEDFVRDIQGVLGHEIDADALGADQPDHLLDLVDQRLGCVIEQQMRLVEEKGQSWQLGVSALRQIFVQFRQQPEQEGGVEAGLQKQLVGGQNVDMPPAIQRGLHQIVQPHRGFAEKLVGPLVLQFQQFALQDAQRLFADSAVVLADRARVFDRVSDQRLQILEVQQQ